MNSAELAQNEPMKSDAAIQTLQVRLLVIRWPPQ
jgi:hypothetical protein